LNENKLQYLLRKFTASTNYTPRFIAGDLIINKFNGKVFIVKVLGLERNEDDLPCLKGEYKLVTLYNDGQIVKKFYERKKNVRAIDLYYQKIDSNVAQVLYDINVKGVENELRKSRY
jgi:hypothetical protein